LLDGEALAGRTIERAHDATLTALAALPGGGFVSACAGGLIVVRDRDGRAIRGWRGHQHWIWGLAHHDGLLWSVAEDGARVAWNVDTGAPVDTTRFAGRIPSAIAVAATGDVAVGFLDGGVETTSSVSISAHTAAVRTILALPGGAWMTGGEDGLVQRLDDARVTTVARRDDFVRHLARLGEHVLAVGYDGRIAVVDDLSAAAAHRDRATLSGCAPTSPR
jgi:hypothetical protein